MKRAIQILMLLVGLTGSLLQAQGQRPAHPPAGIHSGSASASETAAGDAQAAPPNPLEAITQFLSLTPDQVAQLSQLLQAREGQLAPVLQAIGQSEQKLQQLLDSGGAPADVGQLVIQIHTLQQQVGKVQQQFQAQFVSLLTDEQRQRFQAVQLAATLQSIVPAFRQLGLV